MDGWMRPQMKCAWRGRGCVCANGWMNIWMDVDDKWWMDAHQNGRS
jgi:hypothetical protein